MSPEAVGIRCEQLSKTYQADSGAVHVLDDVSLAVPFGSVCAFVGPSGCGKSTLLRLLAGLDEPDRGRVVIGGVDIQTASARLRRDLRRREITYIAQRAADNLVPHLTLSAHLGRESGKDAAEDLGMVSSLQKRADQLSGGEQARAALIVALARRSQIILIDEPTAELDRRTAACVADLLQRAAARGCAVAIATHDSDLIGRVDQVVALEETSEPSDDLPSATAPGVGTESRLEVRDLSKRYSHYVAVDNASLQLNDSEIGVIIGRSGSGKSTLLMAIGGWIASDSGTVDLTGERSRAHPSWETLSYLPQRFGLLPELSVWENITLPLRIRRIPPTAYAQRLLDQLDLVEVAARPPAEVSIGQQQRAALARALVATPRVFIADEPTSHQDRGSARRVWSVIEDARRDGCACLVATHDPSAANRASRVWLMADGRLTVQAEAISATSSTQGRDR